MEYYCGIAKFHVTFFFEESILLKFNLTITVT